MSDKAAEAKLNFLARRSDNFLKAFVHSSLELCLKSNKIISYLNTDTITIHSKSVCVCVT